jgi:hypothetical protein
MNLVINNPNSPFLSLYNEKSHLFLHDQMLKIQRWPKETQQSLERQKDKLQPSALLDFKFMTQNTASQVAQYLLEIAHCISVIALSILALPVDIARSLTGGLKVTPLLSNFLVIPYQLLASTLKIAVFSLSLVNEITQIAKSTVGLLAWHSCEKPLHHLKSWFIRTLLKDPASVLSRKFNYRHIVYNSLGATLLAAGAIFISIPLIQFTALPIIFGSLYGTLNNQFTVRKCPEYYTMGHYFDGDLLRGHAIETNNLLIKPIITGCYATTMVTQIAGVILAAAATLPYATATMPFALAKGITALSVCVSLVTAHIFSRYKELKLKNSLQQFFKLQNIDLTEQLLSETWQSAVVKLDLYQRLREHRERAESGLQHHEDKALYEQLQQHFNYISNSNYSDVPLKFLTGWEANNQRNTCGYIVAGIGTLALTLTTVAVRVLSVV